MSLSRWLAAKAKAKEEGVDTLLVYSNSVGCPLLVPILLRHALSTAAIILELFFQKKTVGCMLSGNAFTRAWPPLTTCLTTKQWSHLSCLSAFAPVLPLWLWGRELSRVVARTVTGTHVSSAARTKAARQRRVAAQQQCITEARAYSVLGLSLAC
jgi:hypothetical protein